MTNQERICNLKMLGYTDREAEFLCLAALHSGYFVRRQFLGFAGRERGKLDGRVGERATPKCDSLSPHRTGRADFPHPALLKTLASGIHRQLRGCSL
jgi:hypothetical protein